MPRRPSRKPRRRSAPRSILFRDTVIGLVSQSTTTSIIRSSLEFPTDRAFKLTSARFEFIMDTSSISNTAIIQVRLYGPLSYTSAIWTSGPFLVGVVPVKKRFRFPSPLIWPKDTNSQRVMIAIDGLCQGAKDTFSCRFVAYVSTRVSSEILSEACPKNLLPGNAILTEASDSDE